ncbi:MAG: IPT/TIG domain-containing protein, partial [Bradymonadaceae bacterium]
EDGLPAGTYTATVTNPGGNDCTSGSGSLFVKPDPSVADVQPSPVCTSENSYLAVIEGSNFLRVNGRTPSVTIGNATTTVQSLRNCKPTPSPSGTTVESCTKMNVTLPQGALATGAISDHTVRVTNPSPADCTSEQNVIEKDVPTPTVSNQDNTVYEACSQSASETMVLTGDYFFDVKGKKPAVTVTFNGETQTYRDPTLGGNCRTLSNTNATTEKCDLMRIRMSKHSTTLTSGTYDVGVLNPKTVQCETTGSYYMPREAPPEPSISGVQPTTTCSTNGQLTITGQNFQRGLEVTLGGVPADNVQYVNSTEVTASWTSAPPGPTKTLRVENPDGCSTSANTDVEVVQGPLAVFLQPPVHYNELKLESLLYIKQGNSSDVESVRIRGPNGVVRELNFTNVAGKQDQLRATLPDEDPQNPGKQLPPGSYDLQVTEKFGSLDCGQWQESALEVVGNEDLTLTGITPQSGFRQTPTDVTINAAANPPSGQTNFLPTP